MEAGAETYESLWKQVRAYEKKDLPKSAYKVVQRIGTKADKEKAKGQQLARPAVRLRAQAAGGARQFLYRRADVGAAQAGK